MQARVEGSEDAPDVQGDGRCGSLPLGVERPEWCRTALYNLLRSTMEVLGSGGVVHWLEFGTLLGAVREGDVIAHTNDVEVASLLSRALPVFPCCRELSFGVSLSCLGQLPCAGKQAILNLVPVFEERNLSLSNQAFPNPHNGVGPRTTLRLRRGTFAPRCPV